MRGRPGPSQDLVAPSAEEGLSWRAGGGAQSARAPLALLTCPSAPQDYCGQNSSLGSFSIFTENVPCGTTGVTCSKAIKIFLGVSAARLPRVGGAPVDTPSDRVSPGRRGRS